MSKERSKANVPKVLENSQRNCKRRQRKNSHDTKTTQAEKGINKVKFLCNKKQHGGATSNINNTPINNLCWGKKVPYFLLPHLVFWVAEKKEATSWRIDPKEPDQ